MKLNTQQINALAKKITDDLNESSQNKNDILLQKELKKFEPLYIAGLKILNDNKVLLDRVTVNIYKDFALTIDKNNTFNNFIDNYSLKIRIQSKLKIKTINFDSVKQDIILATIDTNSIEEITNKIIKKYK